jgi:hypothetical protein
LIPVRRPGHWQQAIFVYGLLQYGAVRYGISFNSRATAPIHARQRTTIQWANADLRSNGTLQFYGADRSCLPNHCST